MPESVDRYVYAKPYAAPITVGLQPPYMEGGGRRTRPRAGLTIVAGTDASNEPGAPFSPRHGSALADELGLLVDAGLTPTEAISSATELPARTFGLNDRGVIAAGRRADVLLVDGDPTVDIDTIRNVRAVWIAGARIA